MKNFDYKWICQEFLSNEQQLSTDPETAIKQAKEMALYFKKGLSMVKQIVTTKGFTSQEEQIIFFKNIKPKFLARLIFYNKVYRIEANAPIIGSKTIEKYFIAQQNKLQRDFFEHLHKSDFYNYYKSGRSDKDVKYFTLGNINILQGVNSFVFELDAEFSTYYDYIIAKIISNELFYNYIKTRLENIKNTKQPTIKHANQPHVYWSDTKAALVELIYALYLNGSINKGNVELQKIAFFFN